MSDHRRLIRWSIHPVLVMLPIGLFSLALLFDIAGAVSGFGYFAEIGYWNLVPGVVTAALAALTGLIDLLALATTHPVRRLAGEHAVVTLWSVALFALVWMARTGADQPAASAGLLLVEAIAYGGLLVGAWLGRRLSVRVRSAVSTESVLGTARLGASRYVGIGSFAR